MVLPHILRKLLVSETVIEELGIDHYETILEIYLFVLHLACEAFLNQEVHLEKM